MVSRKLRLKARRAHRRSDKDYEAFFGDGDVDNVSSLQDLAKGQSTISFIVFRLLEARMSVWITVDDKSGRNAC